MIPTLCFKGDLPPLMTEREWAMCPAYQWLMLGAASEPRCLERQSYLVELKAKSAMLAIFALTEYQGEEIVGACTVVVAKDGLIDCTCEQTTIALNRIDFPEGFGCKHIEFVRAVFLQEPQRLLAAYESATGDLFHRPLAPSLWFDLFEIKPQAVQTPIADYPTDDPTEQSETDPFKDFEIAARREQKAIVESPDGDPTEQSETDPFKDKEETNV